MKKWIWIPIALLLSGCIIKSSTHVLIGNPRPPVPVSQIKMYYDEPASYKKIAIIRSKAGHAFIDQQKVVDAAIQQIKERAASLGANGVLLQRVGEQAMGASVGVVNAMPGSNSAIVTSSRGTGHTVEGIAIYVE